MLILKDQAAYYAFTHYNVFSDVIGHVDNATGDVTGSTVAF
jgi:hypothetical protein